MNLDPWCTGSKVLASVPGDMVFAQAIAAARFKRNGMRQRITVEHPPWHRQPVLYVQDAPLRVEEPCS